MSERNFFDSPLKKVMKLIELYWDRQKKQVEQMEPEEREIREIYSMREIEGWGNG